MKVIFLDIDGVMNSSVFYEERHKKRWFKFNTYKYIVRKWVRYVFNGFKHKHRTLQFHKTPLSHFNFDYCFKWLKEETSALKWKWLSEFCNQHDYKVCISSVWKNHFEHTDQWNDALMALGFNDGIFVGITGGRRTLRGTEIKEWVDQNDVESYAILDDDSDMLPEQLSTCFFHVDGWYGLTPNHLYRIDRYFKGYYKRH